MNSDRYNNKIRFVSFFLGFTTIEEIGIFYNKKLQKWLLRNSNVVNRFELDQNGNYIPLYDKSGNIINAELSKTTTDGIPLTNEDFIKSELKTISYIDSNLLDLSQRKRVEYYVDYLNRRNISEKEVVMNSGEINKTKKYESRIWFKVGLLFANGEMDELLLKHNRNTTKIADELGNISYRPYISESISNTNETDKNIFSSRKKMLQIIDYCKSNQIAVSESFIDFLPIE